MPKKKCENCQRRWFYPERVAAGPSILCGQCRRSTKKRLEYVEILESTRYPLPDETTEAQPGSEEKILVMMERATAKRAIFHPLDRTIYEEV